MHPAADYSVERLKEIDLVLSEFRYPVQRMDELQTVKLLIAICLLVPFLVILNLGLWTALRRRDNPNRSRMVHQARTSITHPWQSEEQKLKELSDRVARIKDRIQHGDDPGGGAEQPASHDTGPVDHD